MALTYFDTSAVVKLLHDENDSAAARRLWMSAEVAFASHLLAAELGAALAASHRNHEFSDDDYDEIWGMSEDLRSELTGINLSAEVAIQAATLAARHALKGSDAVHLASALSLRASQLVFATWDRRLHQAAQAEGFAVAPATL